MKFKRRDTKYRTTWEQKFRWLLFLSVCFVLMSSSCTSRLRIDLYLTLDEARSRVKVESQEYIEKSQLNDALADNKIIPGDNACIVFETGTRGIQVETSSSNLFGYDEYLRCRVYLELIPPHKAGLLELTKKSFVQVMGRFDKSAETKIFTFEGGSMLIDSVVGKHIYMSFDAVFQNSSQKQLRLDGQAKLKKL